jgi:hypothetical protein
MRRTTATVVVAGMMVGLLPPLASAGQKRNKARPVAAVTANGPATAHPSTLEGAALRRGIVNHPRTAPAPAPRPQRPHLVASPSQPRMAAPHPTPMAPRASRAGSFGRTALKIAGVGAVSLAMGALVAAGFAGLAASVPIAAVIAIPAILLGTGAVALISGGTDGPGSVYGNYNGDPRRVLRAAAFQQQRRRQQNLGGNFPSAGQF